MGAYEKALNELNAMQLHIFRKSDKPLLWMALNEASDEDIQAHEKLRNKVLDLGSEKVEREFAHA